ELEALDADGLLKLKFKAGEPEITARGISVDIAQDLGASGGRIVSSHEQEELGKLAGAQGFQDTAVGLETTASIIRLIPEFGIKAQPFGFGGDAKFGGEDIAEMFRILATVSRGVSGRMSYEANKAAKIGSYARREQEWSFQSNLVAGEITQTYKQLRAAQIREYIAKREWENHKQQIAHSQDIEHFLQGEKNSSGHKKTTIQAFYSWMRREVKGQY